jgi:hypothetical protein
MKKKQRALENCLLLNKVRFVLSDASSGSDGFKNIHRFFRLISYATVF